MDSRKVTAVLKISEKRVLRTSKQMLSIKSLNSLIHKVMQPKKACILIKIGETLFLIRNIKKKKDVKKSKKEVQKFLKKALKKIDIFQVRWTQKRIVFNNIIKNVQLNVKSTNSFLLQDISSNYSFVKLS